MAMSPVIKNKPTTTSSLRNLGLFWDDEDDDDVENYGNSPGLAEGDLQLDFPGDSDRPVVDLSWRPNSPDTLRLQPLTFRAKVYAVLEYSVYVRCVQENGEVFRRRRRLKVKDGNGALVQMARAVEFAVFILIILNIAFVLAATDSAVNRDATFQDAFTVIEMLSMVLFGVEYLFRWWACVEKPDLALSGPILGRIRWMFGILPIIDLVAFAAYPIDILAKGNSSAGAREGAPLVPHIPNRVAAPPRPQGEGPQHPLPGVQSQDGGSIHGILHHRYSLHCVLNDDVLRRARSAASAFPPIHASMWWCASCMTTVGYGDLSPITPEGRLVGILTSAASVLAMALPTCIVGGGFIEIMVSLHDADVSNRLTDNMLTKAGWEPSADDSGVWTRAYTQEEMELKREEAQSPHKAHQTKKTAWIAARALSFRHTGDTGGMGRLEARLEKVERQIAAIAHAVGANLED